MDISIPLRSLRVTVQPTAKAQRTQRKNDKNLQRRSIFYNKILAQHSRNQKPSLFPPPRNGGHRGVKNLQKKDVFTR